MKHCIIFLSVVMLSVEANSNKIPVPQITKTDVINHAWCDTSVSAEEKMSKKSLEEVHTYAELKHDPRASLPDLFTICSTIMTPSCSIRAYPTFFAILDNDRAQFLAPAYKPGVVVSLLKILYLQGSSEQANGKIPPLFPNEWTRSCVAVNTTSGLIHWVVEGTLVLTTISEQVKKSNGRPKDLSRKLLLGGRAFSGGWVATSSKVTNLNIFSSALSKEKMKSLTRGENCIAEGDYLAWKDMEWILHGKARIDTVNQEETCKGEPLVNLYYTGFPNMDACMHHCQNLGTRFPPVTHLQDWAKLQSSLKMNLYDKGLNTLSMWLPITDRQIEAEWRDFYTGRVIQNYTQPWAGSKPDGGIAENCAYILDWNTWGDEHCDYSYYACMCIHEPSSYLELKGLCHGSLIDRFYKPVSDLTDSRELRLQGLKGTSMTYDNEKELWILDLRDSNLTGYSKATHATFTLGKHNWTIKGDKGCNGGQSYVTELKMSGCQQGDFTCSDGQCVSMDQRCNQLSECRDKGSHPFKNTTNCMNNFDITPVPYLKDSTKQCKSTPEPPQILIFNKICAMNS